jgi:ferredoxin
MEKLRNKVREWFNAGRVNLVIGYAEGFSGKARAYFATTPEDSVNLIWDERCLQNLMVYVHKPEIKAYKKIGITANVHSLRTILQLAAENQLPEGLLAITTVDGAGNVHDFMTYGEVEDYLAKIPYEIPPFAKAKIAQVDAMPRQERWNFWTEELSSCIKCYACRSACPLCYCTKCTTDCNQPQWVRSTPTGDGNFEWHIMRAMHLAGRCIECGECVRACPMGIPLGILTAKLNDEINADFNQRPGTKAALDYALCSFKVDDKDNFIR